MIQHCIFNSIVGPLYLVASNSGLRAILWSAPSDNTESPQDPSSPAAKILAKTVAQLTEYFDGKRTQFDIPMDVVGTPFQKKVWETLTKIPYGKTFSYKDIAQKISNEKAVRAVGTANGRNPLSIVIPCHRVIGANGTLTGYAGGLKNKAQLLQLEQK